MNELINMESQYYIKIFKSRNNNTKLRNVSRIINDCNKMIRKKIIDLSTSIKNISMDVINVNDIRKECTSLQEKTLYDIDNLNSIINTINSLTQYTSEQSNYIEVYMN